MIILTIGVGKIKPTDQRNTTK